MPASRRATETTPESDAVETLARALRKVIAGTVLTNAAIAAELGIGASEGQFLNLVDLYGPMSPSRLSELTGFSSGAVTGVIDRLERAGYVHRTRAETDRRKVTIALDEQKMRREIEPRYARQAQQMTTALAGLNDRQLETITDFLTRMAQASALH
jgi:DNA-binding MarR family transcriptional regulator